MTRICPKRDAVCPHGDECPYSIDQYECQEEPPTAREMPSSVRLDPDNDNLYFEGLPDWVAPIDWTHYTRADLSAAERDAAYTAGWQAAIEAAAAAYCSDGDWDFFASALSTIKALRQPPGTILSATYALAARDRAMRAEGMRNAAQVLADEAKEFPLGHENRQLGASSYSWFRKCEQVVRGAAEKEEQR